MLPNALETEKENIAKEMTAANRKVLDMKIDLLKADPIEADRIKNVVKAKYTKQLEQMIENKLPERLKAARETAVVKLETELKNRITVKMKELSGARLAKNLPIEISKSLLLLKHAKLDPASQSNIDVQKMKAVIDPELTKYTNGLDLSKAASKYAETKLQ